MQMQDTDWPPEHCDALRDHLGNGMSFSEVADAINAQFNTSYSRSAAIGRAKRMGLAGPERPRAVTVDHVPPALSHFIALRHRRPGEHDAPDLTWPMPVFEPATPVKLRCAEIEPRRLALTDLEPGDCRYPYGGDEDDQAITFCAHPCRPGSSYCTAHFQLTRVPDTAPGPAVGGVSSGPVEPA